MARPDSPSPNTTTHARDRWEVSDWSRRRGLVGAAPGRRHPSVVAVLVVDHDHGHWSSVADTLRAAGYTVVQARAGQEARRMVEHLRFGAIVVDTGASGLDSNSMVPSVPDAPPLVVLSPAGDRPDERAESGPRAVSRLRKPVSAHQLVGAVARALDLDGC